MSMFDCRMRALLESSFHKIEKANHCEGHVSEILEEQGMESSLEQHGWTGVQL